MQDTILSRSDGTQYITLASVSGSAGTVQVAIAATDAGELGNMPAGSFLTLVSPIANVGPQSITGVVTGGADDEDDELLRTRILQRYAAPPQGGSNADYIGWAFLTPGVTRAWVNPNGMGPGTVVVYTMFDDVNVQNDGFPFGVGGVSSFEPRALPATLDLKTVADTIYPLRPVTSLVYSVAPVPAPLDIVISSLSPNTAQVQQGIIDSLNALLLQVGNALPDQIYPSDINNAIEGTTGVNHYTLVSPVSVVSSTLGNLPVLGNVTFSG